MCVLQHWPHVDYATIQLFLRNPGKLGDKWNSQKLIMDLSEAECVFVIWCMQICLKLHADLLEAAYGSKCQGNKVTLFMS